VLAVLALFTGLAFAQQESCTAQGTVSTQLRAEGYTEQAGDIVIQCNFGVPIAPGGNIPLANFTVYFNTQVTSRLLASGGVSEALLIIDEPGSGYSPLTGLPIQNASYGSQLGLIPCATPLTGCAQSVGAIPGATYGTAVNPPTPGTPPVNSSTPAPNVYQGVVVGNSVTFYGVPVLPPATSGSRFYRITNVRVNAQQYAGGTASGSAAPIQASITMGGPGALPISNSAPIVGYVATGLIASASGPTGLQQCASGQTKVEVSTLTFTEGFGASFKTRVNAASNTAYAGQLGNPPQSTLAAPIPPAGNQSIPGGLYYSESDFVYQINGSYAGLADFGTRLKAVFNNIPTGVRVFVSTANVYNGANPAAVPSPIGGNAANVAGTVSPYVGYALLVNGETTTYGAIAGFFPSLSSSDNAGSIGITEVPISNNTGTAIWEVLNTNPTTQESMMFNVYVTYAANTITTTTTSTVNLSFAPTSTAYNSGSSIPKFTGDTAPSARSIFSIGICRTILLYPYLTNQAGFDTGVVVADTSLDPFTTGSKATVSQTGNCTFTFYGGTTAAPATAPSPVTVGPIGAGTTIGPVYANTLGAIAPGFQGYMFAICNFQYAHGFAFISDVGARNLAMGYLALVMPDPGPSNSRLAIPFGGALNSNGEQDAH